MTDPISIPFEAWEPTYEAILASFGFDRAADEAARDLAASYLDPFDFDRLDLSNANVAIVAGAALDEGGIRRLRTVDAVLTTGDAQARVTTAAIPIRVVVTDLDSDPARTVRRTRRGDIVAVHSHGDNRSALRTWLPRVRPAAVIGTTQAHPRGPIVNPGGFTDGDRAAYLAHALGAKSLTFVGWTLTDRSVGATKRRKLRWAARLLHDLEGIRDEHFAVLDPVRDEI